LPLHPRVEHFVKTTDSDAQLNDPSLLKDKTYVNGEWIGAKSGKTFEVHGTYILTSCIFVFNSPVQTPQQASLSARSLRWIAPTPRLPSLLPLQRSQLSVNSRAANGHEC
jgi:hypothetical protein